MKRILLFLILVFCFSIFNTFAEQDCEICPCEKEKQQSPENQATFPDNFNTPSETCQDENAIQFISSSDQEVGVNGGATVTVSNGSGTSLTWELDGTGFQLLEPSDGTPNQMVVVPDTGACEGVTVRVRRSDCPDDSGAEWFVRYTGGSGQWEVVDPPRVELTGLPDEIDSWGNYYKTLGKYKQKVHYTFGGGGGSCWDPPGDCGQEKYENASYCARQDLSFYVHPTLGCTEILTVSGFDGWDIQEHPFYYDLNCSDTPQLVWGVMRVMCTYNYSVCYTGSIDLWEWEETCSQ
ncbi:MAG: hypothetical protein K9L30_08880 [Desulfobacterales bacterium]|nr:hypothetical protein [Desulfobacterales bacterium]